MTIEDNCLFWYKTIKEKTMIDDWKICYSVYYPDGSTVDPKEKFMFAHIRAKNEDEAISILKKEFYGLDVKIFGKPIHTFISEDEYENN